LHDEIEEEEPERQELCSAYDVNVRASLDKIEEEEPEEQDPCNANDVNVCTFLPVLFDVASAIAALPTRFSWQMTMIL